MNVDGVARMVRAAAEQHPPPRFLLISSLAAREPHLSYYAASKRQGEDALALNSGKMPWVVLRPPAVYGPGDRELLPIFQWMARGIAPVIGSGKGRFSLLYVEDLADAIIQWLECGNRHYCTFELHDGHNGGYSWHEIVDTMARLKRAKILRARIPVFFVKLLATVNLMAAKVFGSTPMLTPGKVRELIHPNWVCDNAEFNNHTGWTPRISLEDGLRRTLE
jgi:nucleoside-diphosphate-sugar epimerase